MKILGLLIFFIGTSAQAQELYFNPLVTLNARTIEQFDFALGRSGLGNMNTTALASTLYFGVFQRVEIGTAPIWYLDSNHNHNYTVKWNFYRGENFDWAALLGESSYDLDLELIDENEKIRMKMSAIQLAMNYHPAGSRWGIGASVTNSCGILRAKSSRVQLFDLKCKAEHGIDVQFETLPKQWLTVGHGRMREAGFTPWEELQNGAGLAYTWFRSGKFISRPSVGVYLPWGFDPLFLFTTTFYEGE